ncbi:MAG: hypothetical protein G3M78_07155 [Candidatus Nitrohelix vancouverensis]|uniref:Magnesium transporter MgtE intracellular domain-containing protein n=1 Tax=Candidatus Nitrohelix vancouverensis TaxID=2705534 RepID=A0A7T0C263_9BACT|nr:MAG: hypothetical protein G3M78_07155 [Candidatus Nitrohelix vancouverensis]
MTNSKSKLKFTTLFSLAILCWIAADLTFTASFIQGSSAQAQEKAEEAESPKGKTSGLEHALRQRRGDFDKEEEIEVKLPEHKAVISPETFRMIEMIEKKNRELKKKEEELKVKEQQLQALEQKVRQELREINLALAKSERQIGIKNEQVAQNIESLIKVYSSMKPEEAANILEAVDEELAIQIITGMKAQIAGQVLSQLNVKIAKAISERMVGKGEVKDKTAP